jgi:hypothetical protein
MRYGQGEGVCVWDVRYACRSDLRAGSGRACV